MKRKKISATLLFLLLLTGITAGAQVKHKGALEKPKPTEFDKNKWIEYIPGNIPLVISVSHGGSLKIDSIPFNTCKGHNRHYDYGTIEIARAVQQAFEKKYQVRPYVVICHLSRQHLDMNREMEKATCGNPYMNEAWSSFHTYIDRALKEAVKLHKRAIYTDFHGHPHQKQKVELGYSLSKNTLIALQEGQAEKGIEEESSLRNFFTGNWKKGVTINDMLTGKNSFGSLLSNAGMATVPSMQDKAPLREDPYFAAATVYNTPTYTSKRYPEVIGWQVEMSVDIRKNKHEEMAQAFVAAMKTFMEQNTDMKIKWGK
ncbi:hypothetical protein [Pseudopedobacter beijingensis]|uniref:N-formylglutamate amidohydrolase n=1 Tax=Pseudopedobacter beijingensis TaxID=1207056 RepID=A0ABW4I9M8_9SPHI